MVKEGVGPTTYNFHNSCGYNDQTERISKAHSRKLKFLTKPKVKGLEHLAMCDALCFLSLMLALLGIKFILPGRFDALMCFQHPQWSRVEKAYQVPRPSLKARAFIVHRAKKHPSRPHFRLQSIGPLSIRLCNYGYDRYTPTTTVDLAHSPPLPNPPTRV